MTPGAALARPAPALTVEAAQAMRLGAYRLYAMHTGRCQRFARVRPCPRCRVLDLEASAADAALEVARERAGSRA
jgi:hypothetical protein